MFANAKPLLTFALLIAVPTAALAAGRTELRNICHVKGQEENTLSGLGLVVGLNGTGEAGDLQTMRALSSAMEIMGSPVSTTGRADAESLEELKKIKNAALVLVTATVPATGARRGEKIDCFVSAINGKSLKGGRLAFATLQGPNTQDHQVYALAQGQLAIEDATQPMVARIHGGCQMQQDVQTEFEKDGYITLVLDSNHADFMVASSIGEAIQGMYRDQFLPRDKISQAEEYVTSLVEVRNASNIRIKIPDLFENDPVAFIAQLMELAVYTVDPEARVVVNPRAESIVISGDVGIGDVIVTHRNLTIEANPALAADFRKLEPDTLGGGGGSAKLESLVQALRDLKVPASDIIEIIKGIDRLGKLHGKLIIE